MATTEPDEDGNIYTLIDSPATWESARDACQAAGGQLADVKTAAEEAAIKDLMKTSGVSNAWFCNEVKSGGRYSNWGSDVGVTSDSAYYEPVDRPDCGAGITETGCSLQAQDCKPPPRTACECAEYDVETPNLADRDGDSCYKRHMRNDLSNGDPDESGCFCLECPAGYRVRVDEVEYEQVTDTAPTPDQDHCVETAQVYDGPMCGIIRLREQASAQVLDEWGSEECGERLPYVIHLSSKSFNLPLPFGLYMTYLFPGAGMQRQARPRLH